MDKSPPQENKVFIRSLQCLHFLFLRFRRYCSFCLSCDCSDCISVPNEATASWHSDHPLRVSVDSYHIISHCELVLLSCFHIDGSLPLLSHICPYSLISFQHFHLLPGPRAPRWQFTVSDKVSAVPTWKPGCGDAGESYIQLQNWNQGQRNFFIKHLICTKCPNCFEYLESEAPLKFGVLVPD